MPVFGNKDKLGQMCINMMMVDGVSSIPKGLAVQLTLLEEKLEIKARFFKKTPAYLSFSKINAVNTVTDKEIIEKSKSSVGRAVAGGILFGGLGAIVGAASGIGTKQKSKSHYYFVINYTSVNNETKAVSFEIIGGTTLGLDKFKKALEDKCNITNDNVTEIIL